MPTPTTAATPTPTPHPWRTFEYGKDERDASCDTNPNYRIDVPPGWTKQPYLRCGYVQYRPKDDNALLSVDWWDSPEYSSSPSQAQELAEDHQGSYSWTDDVWGATWTETTKSLDIIEHAGGRVIYYTMTLRSTRLQDCSMTGYRMLTLSKSWVNHAQVVVVAQGLSCDGKAAEYDADLRKLDFAQKLDKL